MIRLLEWVAIVALGCLLWSRVYVPLAQEAGRIHANVEYKLSQVLR